MIIHSLYYISMFNFIRILQIWQLEARLHQVDAVIIIDTKRNDNCKFVPAGKTEYVHILTTEETALETYFMMLSRFNFDRAKEQCVR